MLVFLKKRTSVALGTADKIVKSQRIVLHSTAGVAFVMVWSGVDLTLLDIKWRSGALNVPHASHVVLMALTLA